MTALLELRENLKKIYSRNEAFITPVIKFLLSYIRRHDFKIFGWYRILLGAVVLGYFLVVQ